MGARAEKRPVSRKTERKDAGEKTAKNLPVRPSVRAAVIDKSPLLRYHKTTEYFIKTVGRTNNAETAGAPAKERTESFFMTLSELKVGQSAIILAVGGEGALRNRLIDMGLIPRTRLTLRKVAPMGDPIEIRIRGYELTLRLEDAANITVEPTEETKDAANGGNSAAADGKTVREAGREAAADSKTDTEARV